ncbi:MAG TPA: radical SAM protein [Flavitalea sp.]|nr:radical SAM protein [Flavitalea sp.]
MSKILFTHAYFLRYDPKQWATSQPYPPLATITVAAVCRTQGHQVALYDTMFSAQPEEIESAIVENVPDYFVIYDDGFNYLTKMCLTNMRQAAFRMCDIAKQKGCRIIVSSSDSTDHYDQYLDAGAEFILIGEAEKTLVDLIETIEQNEEISKVKGIAYRSGHATIKTSPRPVLRDLDSLPLAAWDLINIESYRKMWMKSTGYLSLNMATTRGCPYKCNWCAKPIYGNRYNVRSPQHVVRELKLMKSLFEFDHIWFCDDIFGLKPGWITEFSELIKKDSIQIRFKIQARADLLLQPGIIEALAKAGCENAWIGAESGSQKILDAMDKGITIQQIRAATYQLKMHGILPSLFIQFGYPGETKEDIRKTISMVNQLLPHSIGVSVSYPLPGTVFYDRVKSAMTEKKNWTDSDEMQMMFHHDYPPAFYKQLHAYLHKSYRNHLALHTLRECIRKPLTITFASIKKAGSLLYYFPASMVAKQKLNHLAK